MDKLNNSFKNQMKAERIENNAEDVVQSLTNQQPQDGGSSHQKPTISIQGVGEVTPEQLAAQMSNSGPVSPT